MDIVTDPCLLPQDLVDAKLKDPEFVKEMKATLCPGLFETVYAQDAQRIMTECLKHCGGDKRILAGVLQSKFVADHSPFYWTLAGVKSVASSRLLPPLLSKFLGICKSLSPDVQEEILDVLYKMDNDALYQQLRTYLPAIYTPQTARSNFQYSAPSVAGSSDKEWSYGQYRDYAKITFNIPQLFDRLLIDQEVTLPSCLANESVWVMKASQVANPSGGLGWQLQITEVHRRKERKKQPAEQCPPWYHYSKEVTVEIRDVVGQGGLSRMSGSCVAANQSECKTVQIRVTDANLSSFHGNDYLGPGRSLSGVATIKERRVESQDSGCFIS
ncbi:hypothetical protein FA13DRAFT_1739734 [Coprinellus micaceus]|uniref:Uncharacterized protein n=1 Tax=Coprinellus micaceus TaxID=71717 RepID=A0A4Y7SPP6_COPMI|nr:hypothetical protein FA13DRAFT_1739734 [Coprinellus micaceus]